MVATSLFIPQERSRAEQIHYNLRQFSQPFQTPWHGLFLGFAIYGLWLSATRRPILYWGLLLILSWGFILLTSAFPSTRYLIISYPLLGLIFARAMGQRIQGGSYLVMVAIILFALSIMEEETTLSQQDQWEYFSHTSSGYGLRDAAPALLALDAPIIPVLSTVGSCHSLRFYLPAQHPVKLHCPYFGFYDNPELLEWEEWRHYAQEAGVVYLLTENQHALMTAEIPLDLLESFPRPQEGKTVYLAQTPFREDLAQLFPPLPQEITPNLGG